MREGLAPLLANRLRGALAVLAPDWTEDDNPCDNPEPAALDGESQPDAAEPPTFAMRRTAAAERYLQRAQQTSMCTQLARRLLVAEHSVAHEKTHLKLLVCQGAAL